MVDPLTGLSMIAGLAAQLVGLRGGSRVDEIAQAIQEQVTGLQGDLSKFHSEVLEAIDKQAAHSEIKTLVLELHQRLGAPPEEAAVELEVLHANQGGRDPHFHRKIRDKSTRNTDQMEIVGTAFVFVLRIHNHGEKRTVVSDVRLRASVGKQDWDVSERPRAGCYEIDGVRKSLNVGGDRLKLGETPAIDPRDFVDKLVFLLTDHVVPDDVRKISAVVHCTTKWGTTEPAHVTFVRTKE